MKKFLVYTGFIFSFAILGVFSVSTQAQTVVLNDGAILQNNTNRVGVNIGAIDYWDQGQILKNLIGSSDPGMEPLQERQIWTLNTAGTATTFTIPDVYDGVPPNYWAGGTFTIVEVQSGGAELGCTGTIASNTGPNYPVEGVTNWVDPVITVASACAAPFSVGDMIIMNKTTFPTPESWWETGGLGGTAGTVSGGAQLLSDTTDLCATCGTQALNMNATTAGSTARAQWGFDGEYIDNVFVLMNGTYQVSFWAKAASGNPTMTVTAERGTAGGFNCGSYTPTLTSTWTQYTWNCTAAESAANLVPAAGIVSFLTTGGSAYLDNVSFEKINGNAANTTVLRDEVIETLQKFYGPSIGNNPGTFRYWVNQNGESIGNWTQPDYAHLPTAGGTGYFVSPGGMGTETLSLEDYLVICQYLNALPYLEIPVTLTTADAANLVEFLASPSTTTFGAKRAALGQTEPWTSVFSTIHLSFCNECWNPLFAGQSLAARTTGPDDELYYDYSVRARDIFAAMRADQYYSQSALDLVMNAQTANNSTADEAIQRAHPDSIEIEDYTMGPISSFSTDAELWGAAMVDPWEKITNPKDIRNFYQSVHDYQSQTACGASATANCKVNIYEWGQGTISGGIDQTHLDYINAGAGEGVIMALQPLLNLQYYDILPQNFFALTEYKNSAIAPASTSKLWGNTVDMGGATNNLRPTFLGVQVVNQSIIGPMYACPIQNNLTYNFAGSPNGVQAMPAMNNVPYLYAFCFENGTKRSLVLINTDLTTSHSLSFGGINPPSGTVTQRQYAPSTLDEMNEAPTGTASNLTAATSAITTTTLSTPASITLPPFSVTALDYTSPGPQAAAAPTFSPAAGTYTTPQQVTISSTTSGVTLYYTTNGSTPTTSSNVYSGPITVGANETLTAIAAGTNYTTSPAGVAPYVIAPLIPTPTFNVATGTYATTQSIAISESQAGTTIYYTTNGTTPTTSSSVYSGPISVSSTETIEAIAVASGFTTSNAATATFTIAPALPVVTFSPAPGIFTSAQSVTLNEATAGTVIYYTTNGTTPTTSSTQYGGALWISSTETIQAIAVKSGNTTSTPVIGTFNINPVLPTPTFSLATGIYTSTQTVTLTDSQAGTTIYYTTNGSTPTTSSTVYSGPITVSSSETLQAIAVESGYTNSLVGSQVYTVNSTLAPPTFSPPAGIYISSQSVTIGEQTSGATIYYTTNGTTPTTSSSVYSGPVNINTSETLQALAVEAGHVNSVVVSGAYTINGSGLPAPTFSVAAGTYTTAQTVAISDATAGTTIYYTTNGTAPTTSSSVYSGPITVNASETLEAIAVETGWTTSAVATAAYTINPNGSSTLPSPTFSPAGGNYSAAQTVTISDSTAGTTIYYTTNGSTPTTSSSVYSGPVTVSASETLEAIAVKTGSTTSTASSAVYVIGTPALPAVTFSPAPGIFTSAQSVTLSDATPGTVIYYTTNGTTPTTSSTQYGGALWIGSTETLQAIAVATGYSNSPVVSGTFNINPVLPTPTFSLATGIYTSTQTLTISDSQAGTTIYYTTNGSTPTTSSSLYTGPITLSASETVQAIAVEAAYTNSLVGSATYTINSTLALPTITPPGGIFISAQSVVIADNNTGATIYYTTDGSTPTTSSNVYSGPVTVNTSETLQALAVQTNHVNSAVASAAFTINGTPLPSPTFSVPTGTYSTAQTVAISDSTAGVTIYYTTNGTKPTTSSAVYSGPITVSTTETLEAIAAQSGATTSGVGMATYTIASVLPAPTFSPAGGTYTSSQSVTINEATAGTTIYYTTNGTTPTSSSSVYSGPVTVSASETLQAIAVKSGNTNSAAASATYVISTAVLPAVTFSPAPGIFTSAQSVTMSESTPGSVIYYTTNGTTPTTSSTQYGGALWVSSTETIQAIAVASGYVNSPVSAGTFNINPVLPTPTFSLVTGIYTSTQTVTIADSQAGTTIYYTTNGSTPTTSSTVYSGPITVSASETVQAIAVATGFTNSLVGSAIYTINSTLALPTIAPPGGVFISPQSVTIGELTAGATIYYTTNGSTPTTSSNVYTGPVTVGTSETLQAMAVMTGHVNSAVASAAFTINGTALPTPVFSLASGSYTTSQTVTISDTTAGTTIYYTTNGSTPTTSSSVYSGPVTVSSTETLEAIAVETGYPNSAVGTASYTIAPMLPAPTFSMPAATYSGSQSVLISDATAGVTIYYTTNGTTPTTSSTVYSGAVTISSTETLEAVAVKAGYTTSPVTTASYTIAKTLPAVTFSPAPGTFTSALSVTLSDATAGTTIYYTTNGTTPTTASTLYGGALWLTASETIQAIAVATGYSNSPVVTGTFNIDPVLPTPTFSLATGIYTSTQTVTISDATAGTKIYYTTNGTTPTTSSTLYSGPITVSASETVEAIAVETGYTNSLAGTVTYTINSTLGLPAFSISGGIYTSTQSVAITESTAGATIYYTTNGTVPTTSSAVYTGPITVSATETIEAFAVMTGHVNSPVASATYTISGRALAPTFSVPGRTYSTAQSVVISDTTPGASIYYTTNGTVPTTSSTKYSGPVSVTTSEELEAIATATGYLNSTVSTATYTIAPVLPAPKFSVAGGIYSTAQTVGISVSAAGATICFTTNGTTPTSASTKYTGPITVSADEKLSAIAIETGYTNSPVVTASYTIDPVLPTPKFSVAAGTYTVNQAVSISDATAGTTIYYTTNGTAPTTASTKYTAAITVSATEKLEAIAVKTGYTDSAVASASYTIAPVLPAPTFSISGGTFTTSQKVSISESVTGATVYFTTNGAVPTSSSTKYTGAITIAANEKLSAIAVEAGRTNSPVTTASYTIAPVLPVPTFSVAAGTYETTQSVTISDATAGTTIYYTTNGSAPTTASTKYAAAVAVSATEKLEAIAVKSGNTNSPVASVSYTIAPVLPAPTFSVAGGTYTTAQTVKISDTTAGTTIYYTTNGAAPTTASAKYTAAVAVSATEKIQAIAVATGHTNSPVAAAAYTIAPVLPTPSFSVKSGTYTTSQVIEMSVGVTGASIYFTTNGTTPTSASTKYTAPVTVAANETLHAVAVATGRTNSPVASASYVIAPILPAPVFSVPAGAYPAFQRVVLSDNTAGTVIYYTTDGSTPTTSSTKFTYAIAIDATTKLQTIAVKAGFTNSPVASAVYTLPPVLPTPTFSTGGGTYTTPPLVTIKDATAGVKIYYTTNGTTPTTSSEVYSDPISVGESEKLQAMAVASGYINSAVASASYTIGVAPTTYANFGNGQFSAGSLSLNGGATVNASGALQLTDGGVNEDRSGWFSTKVPVQNFVNDFTFQQLNANADGMTFTIQGQGATAVGSSGYSLGYQGITKSVAVKFDLFNQAGEGPDSTGLYTDGAAPTIPYVNLSSTPINLHSGDVMHVYMAYDGSNLTMTITDTFTNGTVTEVFPVDIPALIGGSTAWVGFTGGTGTKTATQNVLSWTYTSTPGANASVAKSTPGTLPAVGNNSTSQSGTINIASEGAKI